MHEDAADYEQHAQMQTDRLNESDYLQATAIGETGFDSSAGTQPVLEAGPTLAMRFRFPKGPKAGVVLHTVFEKHPFTRNLTAEQSLALLNGSGMPKVLESIDQFNDWLEEILATPIAALDGAPLNTLGAERRKMELGFTLSVSQFPWVRALALIERYFPISDASKALIRPELFSQPQSLDGLNRLEGFLNGFMDMVFEHRGKFYIVDWKSNFLGEKFSDYRPSALEQVIAEHDYAVQWCLYSVALLRWLRLKIPGRDPLQLMGGVVYAFVRGMRGSGESLALKSAGLHSAKPSSDKLQETGVFETEVPSQLLSELDALMGGTTLSDALFGQQ
jgi:exodeoxyribonuclease V beta subunit